jgi:aminoglycoside 6'-N-acetyltransferase I
MAKDAAEILRVTFPWRYSGNDAEQEVKRMLSKKRIGLAAITQTNNGARIAGIIGATPQYGVTGWELHPLAVLKEYRKRGFGRMLIEALEDEVAKRGGVMLYLGSDDEFGTTSLYGVDLFDKTFDKLSSIQDTGGHPFPFYEKMGYKIVGVLPDANGIGKPDIWMAKRIKRK